MLFLDWRDMKSVVAIERCASYEPEQVWQAVSKAVEAAGGLAGIVHPGARVLLKANLLNETPPERAVVTHPEVTRAMIRMVKQAGGVPVVGDAPGLDMPGMGKRVLRTSGTLGVCQQEGVEAVLFTDKGYELIERADNAILKSLYIAREVLEADVVIGLAKAKSHLQALYTGAIKNFFGVIPQHNRKTAHAQAGLKIFSRCLVDIFATVRPHFCVMDAVVGMEGRGPSAGDPRHLGLILASADSVALDAVTTACIGYDEFDVPHIRQAAARGLGQNLMEQIQLCGAPLADVRQKWVPPPTTPMRVPGFVNKLAMWLYRIEPRVTKACILCGHCASICPVEAITLGKKKALIDYDRCIACFCCHELCPSMAITEKKSLVTRLHKLLSKDN